MSWLKMTSQAKNEIKKAKEDEELQQQLLAKQKEQKTNEKLAELSSQVMLILEIWEKLDCDRILMDIQKHVLGGSLESLKIVISESAWWGEKEIVVNKTTKGWEFGKNKLKQIEETLRNSGRYDIDYDSSFRVNTKPIQVTRYLYEKRTVENYSKVEESYYTTEETIKFFSLAIDTENIYCDDDLLGKLEEINSIQVLESRVDEVLARKIASKT